MRRVTMLATLALLAAGGVVSAEEARIPIYEPTTITEPGHYVLTRDIEISSGNAIDIDVSHVILDLNGYSITGTGSAVNLIEILDGADVIRIQNGHLAGGFDAIYARSTVGLTIWIANVEIEFTANDGIHLEGAAHVEVIDCTVIVPARGLFLDGIDGGPVTGRIARNAIGGSVYCMVFLRARNAQIVDNVISNCGQQGIQVGWPGGTPTLGIGGNRIQGNTIAECGAGISVYSPAPSNLIIGNVVKRSVQTGIIVASDDNRVAENISGENQGSAPCSSGICIMGARNLVEGNLVASNTGTGCGLNFYGAAATANVYRDNMLMNNSGGPVCILDGASATSAGGNIW